MDFSVNFKFLFLSGLLAVCTNIATAAYDPNKVVHETVEVAARFAEPNVSYATPGFKAYRTNFTSHAEVMAFIAEQARRTPHIKQIILGTSQIGLPIPAVLWAQNGEFNLQVPTVLVIGQQHGNEPASGEAALALIHTLASRADGLLKRVNVLVLPRGNPDGADSFNRTTASGVDVNRDHLLLNTPEGRAIALAVKTYRPQVVLDLHEFTVAGRWVEKFNGLMKYDALIQPATVGNLDPRIAAHAQHDFVERITSAWEQQGITSFTYHTTASASPTNTTVSMGGVQPDTGRNVAGLRPAISLLIEVRGVGIGRAHFLRRVHTQVLAATTVVETAADQGAHLLRVVAQAGKNVAKQSCKGELTIEANHTAARQVLTFLDPVTGADKPTEVAWQAAEPLHIVRSRARPCGYVLAAHQTQAIERLRQLGVQMYSVRKLAQWNTEHFVVTAEDDGKRQDARGSIEDGQAIRKLEVRLEPHTEKVVPGMVYVPMHQPLAGLISAAMEPDSQNSFVANRLLQLEAGGLRRVVKNPKTKDLRAL